MADQPDAFASLDDFFRSFARPELDRAVEEKVAESRERGRRLHLRSLHGSFDSLESLYGFVRDDVRRLERCLDEISVSVDRHEPRGVGRQLENARFKHEQTLAGRNRLVGYLARLDQHIEEFFNYEGKDGLQAQSAGLRRRVDELAAPLATAAARLDRYEKRLEGTGSSSASTRPTHRTPTLRPRPVLSEPDLRPALPARHPQTSPMV